MAKSAKSPKPIMGPQRRAVPPGIFKKYVDPTSSEAQGGGMSSFFGIEVQPVDMNYAAVPTELTQADKEGTENLQKVMDTTMERFGLKY
jgi:hypothetical protein